MTDHELPRVASRSGTSRLHVESGLRFIERWSSLRAARTTKYEDDSANVSVRYENGVNCYVSVFVFRARLRSSQTKIDQAHRTGAFDMLRTITQIRACDECTVGFARPGMRPVLGKRSEVVGRLDHGDNGRAHVLLSSFWLYAEYDWAVKFRATCAPAKGPLVRQFVAAWLEASGIGADRAGESASR